MEVDLLLARPRRVIEGRLWLQAVPLLRHRAPVTGVTMADADDRMMEDLLGTVRLGTMVVQVDRDLEVDEDLTAARTWDRGGRSEVMES